MTVIENVNLIKDYEIIRKRVKNLKEGRFDVAIMSHPDINIDNKIRDEVLNLIALAEKHKIKTRLYQNHLNNKYVLSFEK
jgi:hypothetical protein